MPDTVINWAELKGPTAWNNALKTLQQAGNQATTGTLADRQAVEQELTNFWTIPCPYTRTIEQAKSLFNQLVLIDLKPLIVQPPQVQPEALTTPPRRALAPHEAAAGQQIMQSLATLHAQHQQQLANQLQLSQQLAALQLAIQQMLSPGPKGKK